MVGYLLVWRVMDFDVVTGRPSKAKTDRSRAGMGRSIAESGEVSKGAGVSQQ
jgi:hypothetical protein